MRKLPKTISEGQTVINWFVNDYHYWQNYYFYASNDYVRLDAVKIYPKKNICKKCNVKTNTYIHHIIPISKGGSYNLIANMTELCLLCHAEVHKWKEGRLNHSLRRLVGLNFYNEIRSIL